MIEIGWFIFVCVIAASTLMLSGYLVSREYRMRKLLEANWSHKIWRYYGFFVTSKHMFIAPDGDGNQAWGLYDSYKRLKYLSHIKHYSLPDTQEQPKRAISPGSWQDNGL